MQQQTGQQIAALVAYVERRDKRMDEPIKERPIEPESQRSKAAENTPDLEPTKPDQKNRDRKPR